MRSKPFAVTSVAHTSVRTNGDLEVILANKRGTQKAITLTAETIAALAEMLQHHTTRSKTETGPRLTRQPDTYAVGTGRHERVVLLRIEDDMPYSFAPDDARELGLMLLDEAKAVSATPPVRVH